MIRDYGGAFVADVVGLGKSFIGAAVLKQFERNEQARGLIVCPAHLVPMWERYNEHYQLNARVVSMGLLREGDGRANAPVGRRPLPLPLIFVLVDESHNFRNTDTQRYRILQQFLAAGKRCCFLTATSPNKSSWNIFTQIKLFHQEDKTDLPIEPARPPGVFPPDPAGGAEPAGGALARPHPSHPQPHRQVVRQ